MQARTLAPLLAVAALAVGCTDDTKPDELPRESPSVTDGGVDGAQLLDAAPPEVACTTSSDCSSAMYCASHGYCVDRCDDGGICMIVEDERYIASLAADGPTLYIAMGAPQDRFGNPLSDAELFTRVGDGPLTPLARDSAVIAQLDVRDDYVYWRSLVRTSSVFNWRLKRMRKSGGAVETIYPDAPAELFLLGKDGSLALRTADGVYVGSSDGTAELRKVLQASDCQTAPDQGTYRCGPFAVTREALYFEPVGYFSITSIDLETLERTDHGSGVSSTATDSVDVSPPYLYVPQGYPFYQLVRRDLRDPTVPEFRVYRASSGSLYTAGSRAIQHHGEWMYILGSYRDDGDPYLFFERVAALGPANAQTLVPRTFRPHSTADTWALDNLAVGDDYAYFTMGAYVTRLGAFRNEIYRVPLPSGR